MLSEQTTISLPMETKRELRILAAELGIPMGKTALKLIEFGLDNYRQQQKGVEGSCESKNDDMPQASV